MNDPSRLLALDPSSSAIGWAVFAGEVLQACGVWKPKGSKAPLWDRIDQAIAAVAQMVDEAQADQVVVEITSGRAIAARRSQTSIVALGQAQGAIYASIFASGVPVSPVTEQEWTGRVPKQTRADQVRLIEPIYSKFCPSDPGLDAADAIGVGRFWLNARRTERLLRGA